MEVKLQLQTRCNLHITHINGSKFSMCIYMHSQINGSIHLLGCMSHISINKARQMTLKTNIERMDHCKVMGITRI